MKKYFSINIISPNKLHSILQCHKPHWNFLFNVVDANFHLATNWLRYLILEKQIECDIMILRILFKNTGAEASKMIFFCFKRSYGILVTFKQEFYSKCEPDALNYFWLKQLVKICQVFKKTSNAECKKFLITSSPKHYKLSFRFSKYNFS